MKIEAMKEFKKSNIANAIFLNVITLGFYSISWLGEQRKNINSKTTSNQSPIYFIFGFLYLIYKIDKLPTNQRI